MRGGILFRTLNLLDLQQREDLFRFVKSPYFNTEVEKGKSPSVALFSYLLDKLPLNEKDVVEEGEIFAFIFPEQAFVPGKVDKVMSALLKLVRLFLAYESSGLKDENNQSVALAKFYRAKNWIEKFETEINKIKKYLENMTVRDDNYYLQNLSINQEIYALENWNNQRKGDLNLPNVLFSLDLYYIVTKYKYIVLLRQQQKYVEIKTFEAVQLTQEIRNSIPKELFEKNPLLEVYEKLLQLINAESTNLYGLFNDVRKLLEINTEIIPLKELKELQAYLRNFCTAMHNAGDIRFLYILFELYQYHLDKGYIQEEEKIIASALLNIVTVGLRLKKYDWVKTFLTEYKGKISGTQFPDEVFNLNYANYFFHVKNYDKAWSLLDWNYEDIYYKLASKRMEVKILFEQKEQELLDSKVNALKVYLYRADTKIIAPNIKKMNNDFINYLSQIISSNTFNNPARIRKIQEKIIAQKAVAEREWLLEKIEGLLKK